MKRLLLLIIVFCSAATANAQWHFTITSMNYNDNCSGGGWNLGASMAETEVAIRMGMAESEAAKTYSTREECEAGRSVANMNYSNSGCYLRITTSPCTGGNIGGGAAGGDGLGSGFQAGSLYSSIAIGENYFTPNAAHSIPDQGRELEIKLEALNKNFQNARNGIKTGDKGFNEIYKRQSNELKDHRESQSELYALYPRTSKIYLEKENDFSDGDVIPNIDNTISPSEIEWDKELETKINGDENDNPIYVRLFDAPSLDDQLFPNANVENVQRYFDNSEPLADIFLRNPHKLEFYLETQFESASGFNLKEIRNKQPNDRTEEEKQALIDYEAYRVKEMEQMNRDIEKQIDNSQEKKEIDAAILALDSYGDDEEGWLSQTNYKKLDLESLSNVGVSNEHQSILSVAEKINECNNRQSETGFHAELYYNEATNSYVISFRGTEFTDLNDIKTDYNILKNALGSDDKIKQYEMAMEIAEVINKISKEERDNLNIEVVGHSLGGGLASIVGLETGIETKTYNASMVPDGFLKEKGLYDKVNNGDVQNITAYNTSTDPLTIAQNTFGSPAIGISRDIGDPSALWERAKTSASGAMVGAEKVGEVGGVAGGITGTAAGAIVGAIGEGHRMSPITRHFFNNNNEKKKAEWDYIHNAQYQLQKELRSAEIKQDLKRNY